MTFYEILKASDWTGVWTSLLAFYPDQEKYHTLYVDDYETLQATAPAPFSDWTLVLEDVETLDGDSWTEVHMVSSHGDGERYSLDCVPWREVLAMDVYSGGRCRSDAEIVAHVLLDHASSCF